jgi:hypothetical protein
MRAKALIALVLAGAVVAGCSANALKARKDDAWSRVPQSLPDSPQVANGGLVSIMTTPEPNWASYDQLPSGYGHPMRLATYFLHPVGVALDYALVQPLYMLGGLAPEWFGLTNEDASRYQSHMPELTISREAPRRFP